MIGQMLVVAVSLVAVIVGSHGDVHADNTKPARQIIYEASADAFQLLSHFPGGDVSQRGGSLGGAIGTRVSPSVVVGGQLQYARSASGSGGSTSATYLNGFAKLHLVAGVHLTGELVTARLHFGHRADATGIGFGSQLRYELEAGGSVSTNVHVGARWMRTNEDDSSYRIDDALVFAGGVGAAWH